METETILFLGKEVSADIFSWVILVITLWDLVWKAVAIYMAAGRGARWWAVAVLVFNTMGILPIIYIFGFAGKMEKVEVESISEPVDGIEIDINEQ